MPDIVTRFPRLVCLVAGVVAGLGQVPFSLVPLSLAAFTLGAMMCRHALDARAAAVRGLAFGVGYFALTLHWIVEPFFVDLARDGWMAPFAIVLMSCGFALFWAAAFGFARALGGTGWRHALSFGFALTAAEMLRGHVLTGFPWATIGYVWSESPAAQIVSLAGPYGLTALTLLGVGALAGARRIAVGLGGAVLFWGGGVALGLLILPDPLAVAPDAPRVRLVQPNAPQDEKWDPDHAWDFFDRQLAMTAAGTDGPRPDLVVWPETAIPFLFDADHPELARMVEAADGVPLVFGGQRLEGARAFNSLFVIDRAGAVSEIYDKHHLVPFGEYMPLGGITRLIGLQSFAAKDGFGYSAGPGPRLIDLGTLGEVLPLICYEAIFPRDARSAGARPDWMLQITNDAWFGTFAGPQQSLAQARMRSIEQGLPMLRVANTGISAVIDARGVVRAQIPLGEAGSLDAPIPPARPATFYAWTGDLPLAFLLGTALAALALTRRRQSAVDIGARTD